MIGNAMTDERDNGRYTALMARIESALQDAAAARACARSVIEQAQECRAECARLRALLALIESKAATAAAHATEPFERLAFGDLALIARDARGRAPVISFPRPAG